MQLDDFNVDRHVLPATIDRADAAGLQDYLRSIWKDPLPCTFRISIS